MYRDLEASKDNSNDVEGEDYEEEDEVEDEGEDVLVKEEMYVSYCFCYQFF